ncbi:uncharacterized [Tachysurus ichikawai]
MCKVPGGRFPFQRRVRCKPEARIRKGLSNPIDKQVGLTSSCEPGVSVFSEAGDLLSDPRGVCLPPPPFNLTKVETVLWASLLLSSLSYLFIHWPRGVKQQPAHISAQLSDMRV